MFDHVTFGVSDYAATKALRLQTGFAVDRKLFNGLTVLAERR